ncbi:MAG: polysaccharide deacetylase family protein [Pseudobdellovibrionaceae bacterium]
MYVKIVFIIFIVTISFGAFAEQVVEQKMKCENGASYPVHLSFDDGPKIPDTEIILDILKKNGLKATFLVSSSHFPGLLKGHPSEKEKSLIKILKRIKAEGNLIGSHSFEHLDHVNLQKNSKEVIDDNLKKNEIVLEKLGLKPPMPFRFPFGAGWFEDKDPNNQAQADFVMKKIKSEGYTPFHWDIDSWDWSKIKRKALPESILKQICSHGGGIILMHDIHSFTAQNLQAIINSIISSGHTLVSNEKFLQINSTRPKDQKYISLSDRAAGIFSCGRPVGDLDEVWPSCTTYISNSSDLMKKTLGEQ